MKSKKRPEWLVKLTGIIEKKNFYVMIAMCVGIMVFGGLFVTSRNIISSIGYENEDYLNQRNELDLGSDNESSKNVYSSNFDDTYSESVEKKTYKAVLPEEEMPNKAQIANDKKAIKSKEKEFKKKSVALNVDTKKATEKISPQKIANLFDAPVKGKICFDYSEDKPVYSKTLNEWRTHCGIDIKDEAGTPIRAAREGVVTEVKNDPRYGYTIIVEHDQGLKTVYSGMVKSDMVVPNQKVKAGDVLGSLGNTAPFEALEPPHLHFEVLKNGKNVNPRVYLPQISE